MNTYSLANIMNTYSLADIWRNTHSTAKGFTHWSIPASSGSRPNRWLTSDSLLALFTATSSILPTSGFISDHRPVSITLSFLGHAPPNGQGLQGFTLLLLNIPEACDELKDIIALRSLILFWGFLLAFLVCLSFVPVLLCPFSRPCGLSPLVVP